MCYARKNRKSGKTAESEKLRIALLSPNFSADYEKARVAINNLVSGWGRGLSVGGFCFRSDGDSLASSESKNFLSVAKKKPSDGVAKTRIENRSFCPSVSRSGAQLR